MKAVTALKSQRQAKILEIISTINVETQEQLLQELEIAGFRSTQATISRDIKELKLVKAIGADGRSCYTVGTREPEHFGNPAGGLLPGAVLSTDAAMNTCVIKTRAGMAGAVCAFIDGMEWDGLLGTIAGDDTIFALCRNEEKARKFREDLRTFLGK